MEVRSLLLIVLVTFFSPLSSSAAPINTNSDFSAGFSGWSPSGDVSLSSGIANLFDSNGGGSLLQSTNTGPGSFVLSFDLINLLAPKADPGFNQGVFADIAAGTLYFSNSALTYATLAGNSSATLFDSDASGVVTTLTTTPLGGGWFHYSLAFTTAFNYVTTVFDLFDQDFVQNSSIYLDNVKIEAQVAPVPEPASLLLLAGALPFVRRRAR